MSAYKASKSSSRDRIKTSKFAPHQLARQVTLQVQRAHHAADDFIEQNSSELAKVALVGGALVVVAFLLRRKSKEEESPGCCALGDCMPPSISIPAASAARLSGASLPAG
jgi:hypothetical protein